MTVLHQASQGGDHLQQTLAAVHSPGIQQVKRGLMAGVRTLEEISLAQGGGAGFDQVFDDRLQLAVEQMAVDKGQAAPGDRQLAVLVPARPLSDELFAPGRLGQVVDPGQVIADQQQGERQIAGSAGESRQQRGRTAQQQGIELAAPLDQGANPPSGGQHAAGNRGVRTDIDELNVTRLQGIIAVEVLTRRG